MRGRFDQYTFDTTTRALVRDSSEIHLSPKALDLLEMLIEARPRALSKQEILDRVWAGTFVSEGTLSVVVAELRGALGDDAREPRFIKTHHRFGYSFCGAFELLPELTRTAQPAFRLLWGNREIPLLPGRNVLGRSPEAVAWIDDASISRRHAVIEISPDAVTIHDLGSKNGTWVHGQRVTGQRLLTDGDPVTLGRVPMVFRIFRDGGPTTSIHSSAR